MDLDAGAVDEQPVRRVLGAGQGAENVFPYPALGPAHEAVVERLLRTVDARAIGPPAAATQGVDDPAQHPTIIHPLLAAHVGRQQRLDPSPLRIRKPKEIRHPTPPASEAVTHAPVTSGILLLGPDPRWPPKQTQGAADVSGSHQRPRCGSPPESPAAFSPAPRPQRRARRLARPARPAG